MTAKKATKKTTKKTTKKAAASTSKTSRTVTKRAAKKTETRARVVKKVRIKKLPKGKPLEEKDLIYFFQLLLEKRRELVGDVGYMNDEAMRNGSSGEMSNMPIHMADIGTDNYEQEFMLGLIESERKMLREIDYALMKIKEGGYGVCEGTGEPIERARLEAKPEARYCIEYARKIEKGLVTRPTEDYYLAVAGGGDDDEETQED